MEKAIIKKNEKVSCLFVGVSGGERRHFSVITVLLISVLLCCNMIYYRYSAIVYYRGSYYCDLIRMPPLGNILESTVAFFHVKKILQFQNFYIRRYGLVSTSFCVSPENLSGKSGWGNSGVQSKNGG